MSEQYTDKGLVTKDELLVPKIEILVKALGTMVLKPQFQPTTVIGEAKMQMQPIQEGILIGDNRTIAEQKLVELIKQL